MAMPLDAVVLLVFLLIEATLVSSAMADLILTLICEFGGFRSAMDSELSAAECVGLPTARPTWQLHKMAAVVTYWVSPKFDESKT